MTCKNRTRSTTKGLILALICAMLFALAPIVAPQRTHAADVPKIHRISDAVGAGDTFTVTGWELSATGQDVAIKLDTTGTSPAAPPSDAIHPSIVQSDRKGNYVTAVMPSDAAAGVYNVWVKNATGWSAPAKMNASRAQWISEKEAWAGQHIKIVGRNLVGVEFGAANQTIVRLKNASATVTQTIASSNAYMAEFTIGSNTPQGTYDVEISNDNGVHWSKPNSGQQLTIVGVGSDPLGLGVAWAGHFNWANQVQASAYGANPNSGVDETADIQAAIDAAGANPNGGVVYLADGTYRISSLHLSRKVVLMGQSRAGTILQYTGTNGVSAIDSKTNFGEVGVANLTITIAPGHTSRPDIFLQLGSPWEVLDANGNPTYPAGDTRLRTAEKMFLKNVKIDYTLATNGGEGQRGFPMMTLGKERFLVADCDFRGFAGYAHNYVNQYSSLTNTYLEFSFGVYINSADYYVATGNTVIGYDAVNAEKHGLSVRANNYVAGNTIVGMRSVVAGLVVGHENDGEAIMSEAPGGYFNYGEVDSVDGLNVTVQPVSTLSMPAVMYSYPAIQIIDGTGLGQLRKVTNISGNVITIDKPWDKPPDATSKWTLISPNENVTVYDNTVTDNDKGIWLFGNAYDSLVADNDFLDSEGVFIWSVNVLNATDTVISPGYFNRVTGNVLTGVSPLSKNSGVGVASERFDNGGGHYYAVQAFANEFRNNDITGTHETPIGNSITEAPAYNTGIYVSTADIGHYDGNNDVSVSGDTTNTIIEDNTVRNKQHAVTLTHSTYGTVLADNKSGNVTGGFANDTGAHNTYSVNNAGAAATQQAAAAPTFSPAAGSYSTAQTVTLATSTAGATIRYTTDGSTPTAASKIYRGPLTVAASQTVKAIAAKAGMTASSASSAAYTITSAPTGTIKLTGTAFGTTPAWGPNVGYKKAFDNDTTTYFDYQNPDGGYTGIDLGAGNAKKVVKIRFYPRTGLESRMNQGKFQGSNTSSSSGYVDLATVTSAAAGWTEVTVTDPTAYRYLRYLSPNGSYGNIAEAEFYTSASSEILMTGTAFGTSPAWGPNVGYEKAFDNDTTTYFDYQHPDGGYTGIDLGAGNAKPVVKIRYYPRTGLESRMIQGKFQGSNTSATSGYVDLATVTSASAGWSEIAVTDPTAYRYLRYLSPNGSYGNIAEVEFYTSTASGTALNRSGWTATASHNASTAAAAFDGNASTRWDTNAFQSNGQTYTLDMGSSQTFNKIVLDSTGSPYDYARGYAVQVSADGSTWSGTVASGTGSGAVVTISLPPQNARYIRITQTGSSPDKYWSIHELNVYS